MRPALLLIVALLTACGRELTPAETDFATRLFGEGLDTTQVRLVRNGLVGLRERSFRARPQTTCRERIVPPPETEWLTGSTAGIAFWNHLHIRANIYAQDFTRDDAGRMRLGEAMFLAHELTHVWQWQNRAQTGYSPIRGGLEQVSHQDPYLFDERANPQFLDYGYEQQASLVEEYVCCLAVDPQGARTGRLHALLAQVMEPGALPQVEIVRPWPSLPHAGACH